MNVATKKRDLPENLFSTEEDSEVHTSSDSDDEPLSEEMKSIVGKVSKKLERRKKTKTIAASSFDRACIEVEEMIKTGKWAGCRARHLVALYDLMHYKCYKIEDASLGSKERYNATMLATTFTKREFGEGNFVKVVEYMRWLWSREMEREKWRRENYKEGGRLGYYHVFGNKNLTEYKLYLARNS